MDNLNYSYIKNISFKDPALPYEEITIEEWLKLLLLSLWDEREQFSGKRPFGESSWDFRIYEQFIKHKVIEGTLDEHGYVQDCSDEEMQKADHIIERIIRDWK